MHPPLTLGVTVCGYTSVLSTLPVVLARCLLSHFQRFARQSS